MKGDKLYMLVTDDKFELPIAVFDTAPELARFAGCTVNSIRSSYSHAQAHGYRCKYQIVDIKKARD